MSTTLPFGLTAAGQQALFNANSTGTQLELTHVQFGSGNKTPDDTETALLQPEQTKAIAGGYRVSAEQIRVRAVFDGAPDYQINEAGIWAGDPANDGILVFYASQATGSFAYKVANANVVFAHDMTLTEADPNGNITVLADSGQSTFITLLDQHEQATDPHPQYVTDAEMQSALAANGNASQAAAQAVADHEGKADPHPQYTTDQDLNDAMAAHNASPNPHPQYMSRDQSSAINLIQNSRFNDLPENSSTYLSTTAAFAPPSLLLPVSSTAGWQSIGRSYNDSSTYGGSNSAIPAPMKFFTDAIGLGTLGSEYFGAQLTIDSTSSATFTQNGTTYRYLFQNAAEIISNNSGWVEFSCWMKVVSGEVQLPANFAFAAKGATGYSSTNAISITPADGVVFVKLAWNSASGGNSFAPFLGGIAGTVVQFVLPCITSGVFGVATTRRNPQPSIAAFQRKGEIVSVPMALIASGSADQSSFTTYNLPASIPKDARTVQLWITLTASNSNGSAGTSSRATAGRQQQILFGVGGQSGSGFIQGNNAVLAACLPSTDGVAPAKIDLLNQLTGTGNWQVYAMGYLA